MFIVFTGNNNNNNINNNNNNINIMICVFVVFVESWSITRLGWSESSNC